MKQKKILHSSRLTLLVILDGFGLADPKRPGNAITPETAPHIFGYMKQYPATSLLASGEAVGLFPGQQGNSEAGHFNIGAGRVVKQDLVYISEAIHNGTFFKNEAFKQALYHAKKYKTAAHILALLSREHSVHTMPEHLYAMIEYLRRNQQKEVYLHLITDGRDSSPHGAPTFLHELRGHLLGHEKIATIMGRFYAMDRNRVWSRTKRAYEAMVAGRGCAAASAEEALEQAYNRGETDEYVCPSIIMGPPSSRLGRDYGEASKKPVATVGDNDIIFFVNARSDRARQITKAFVQSDFQKLNPGSFVRQKVPKNIRFVAMTDFGPDLPGVFTAFHSPDIPNSLAKAIGGSYRQLYLSESEKYAHVTYFINGGYAEPINGEERFVVRSSPVTSYAEEPAMHVQEMTDIILAHINKGRYNFITVNFPNADMMGHTGNFSAAKQALRAVDSQVKRLVEAVLKRNGQLLIVGDHGNAEEMIDLETNEILTEHTTNPVPGIVIGQSVKGKHLRAGGMLADVAPTLLKLMEIEKPVEMTGRSLL